jgi:hypothetical protein
VSATASDLALLAGAFALATAVAELLGAANLGTAMTAGVITFAVILLWVLLARR